MENNKIPIIALAVFSMSILLSVSFIIELSYSVDFVDYTTNLNNADAPEYYTSGGNAFFAVMTADDPITVRRYNANTGAFISVSSDLTSACESGATAGTCFGRALDCLDGGQCWILASVTVGTARGRLIDVNQGTVRNTTDFAPLNAMDCTSSNCYVVLDNAGVNPLVQINTSTGIMTTLVTDVNISSYSGSIEVLSIGSTSYYVITSDTLNAWFKAFRTDNLVECTSLSDHDGTDTASDGTYFYVGTVGGTVQILNANCVIQGSIPNANLCGGTPIQDIAISGDNLYSYCESNNKVAQTDITNPFSTSLIQQIGCSGAVPTLGNYQSPLAYNTLSDSIACANFTSDSLRIIFLGGAGGESSIACVDTNLDGITDVCFTDTNGDGVADSGTSGSFGTFRVGQNITQSSGQLLCAIGLSQNACTNTDPKTNGTGYWLLLALILITLIFVYGGAKYFGYDLQSVPLYLVAVLLLVDVGIAFFSGWTDGMIFYTLIFIFVGLGAIGVGQKVLAMRSNNGGG